MTEFKIRCSAISQIMSDPRDKGSAHKLNCLVSSSKDKIAKYNKLKTKDGKMGLGYIKAISENKEEIKKLWPHRSEIILSDTCLSHLRSWHNFKVNKRSKNIETKVIKKGIWGEEKSTTLLNSLLAKEYDYQSLVTSKGRPDDKRRTDDFKTGECDIYIPSHRHIRDIKTSWDISTFPGGAFPKRTLDKNYHDQMQGYLDLWDCEVGFVDYCLIDTPAQLVSDEISRLNWKYHITGIDTNENDYLTIDDQFIPLVMEKVNNMIYTREGLENLITDPTFKFELQKEWFNDFVEIPAKERHIGYEVVRDKVFMGDVHDRVIKVRKYIGRI